MRKNQLGKVNTQFKEMTDKVGMLIKKIERIVILLSN